MNKVNSQILGNLLLEMGVGEKERQTIGDFNRGKGTILGRFLKSWDTFQDATKEISRRRIVLEAMFPELANIEQLAEQFEWTSEGTTFKCGLDLVRADILELVIRIQKGEESARGELKIKFTVAKEYFGNHLDHGQGYEVFFSKKIVEKMDYFKEDFQVVES